MVKLRKVNVTRPHKAHCPGTKCTVTNERIFLPWLNVVAMLNRLRCFIHRLISPMHRIDASNFQPMNGIKQHLRELYNVKFVLIWAACPSVDNIFLINCNFQQRNFITRKKLILIYLLYISISYDCCSDNRCLTGYIVAIGNSSVHRSSTPVE